MLVINVYLPSTKYFIIEYIFLKTLSYVVSDFCSDELKLNKVVLNRALVKNIHSLDACIYRVCVCACVQIHMYT